MTHIVQSALLSLIEQAATSVAILMEGVERGELLRSRLTRAEVLRQLRTVADSMAQVDAASRSEMPELDWAGWQTIQARLAGPPGESLDDTLWFACQSLVPATLLWLRVYQQSQPTRFRMVP